MKYYFDIETRSIVSRIELRREYRHDHAGEESFCDYVRNSLTENGGTLIELPGDLVPADAVMKSDSESISLDSICDAIAAMDDEELEHIQCCVQYERNTRDEAERSMLLGNVFDALLRCVESTRLFSSADRAWFNDTMKELKSIGR